MSDDLLKQYYELREERLELERKARAISVEEEKVKYQITLAVRNSQPLDSRQYLYSYEEKSVPYVEDWALFTQWIIDNDAPDVLQKRITESAVKARLAEGIVLPGVTMVKKPVLEVMRVGEHHGS